MLSQQPGGRGRGDRCHDKRGDPIGPPPPESRVQTRPAIATSPSPPPIRLRDPSPRSAELPAQRRFSASPDPAAAKRRRWPPRPANRGLNWSARSEWPGRRSHRSQDESNEQQGTGDNERGDSLTGLIDPRIAQLDPESPNKRHRPATRRGRSSPPRERPRHRQVARPHPAGRAIDIFPAGSMVVLCR